MYFDLFVPFPIPQTVVDKGPKKGKKDKGKSKLVAGAGGGDVIEDKDLKVDYWGSVTQLERERSTRSVALAGHCRSFLSL